MPRIVFNPAEYSEILNSILNRNERCRHKQCDFTRPNHQCRLCLNPETATSTNKICSVHKKHISTKYSPYLVKQGDTDILKLNRRGQVRLGFDRDLLTDVTKWFADDAIRTALVFMTAKAQQRNVSLCLHTPANGLERVVKVPNSKFRLDIFSTSRHWMVILRNSETNTWYLFNSKQSKYYTESVLNAYNLSNIEEMDSLQQLNDNDCGAFTIYNTLCLLHRKSFNKEAHEIRDYVLKFLASRGNVKY